MKGFLLLLLAVVLVPHFSVVAEEGPVAIIIHGGTGGIDPETTSEELQQKYRQALEKALGAGHEILVQGGTSLDAVEAAIVILEDSPLFNAGKGAVFTSAGENEMDASIMDGQAINAGAVGGVTLVKNPIKAARAVMDESPHVMLMGDGADSFSKAVGLEVVERDYFRTEERWQQWQQAKGKGFAPEVKSPGKPSASLDLPADDHFGTVGAVALDSEGNIAAGTSTGGLLNKGYGRIGDSPIIAAGTYANNLTCGISCTGHGEFFIRHVVAYDIAARMEYAERTLQQAAREVVQEKLKAAGGSGGVIGLNAKGEVVAEFNTAGMFYAWIDAEGRKTVAIEKTP